MCVFVVVVVVVVLGGATDERREKVQEGGSSRPSRRHPVCGCYWRHQQRHVPLTVYIQLPHDVYTD